MIAYLAAHDGHRAQIHGRCADTTGIVPFTALVEQVMTPEPYKSADRVFWVVDNGSSHRGQKAIDRLEQKVRQANDRRLVGRAWEGGGLVFTTEIGTPLEPRNVNRRFYAARSAAGLEWVRLHDLRHAFATFLLDQGEGLRTVMDRWATQRSG